MQVFISWSGQTSKAIAETLRGWLPSVLQAVKPYFSPDDIAKGSRWSTEIAKELEDCKVGLICLTAENLEAPWIMFEAGALSKSLSNSRVAPLLFGIDPSDIKGPLVQFQAAPFQKDEMKKAVRMMNQELGVAALATEVLDGVFEMWWPTLDTRIKALLAAPTTAKNARVRSERDILEEILARVRSTSPSSPRIGLGIHPMALEDLLRSYEELRSLVEHTSSPDGGRLEELVSRLHGPVHHIVRRAHVTEESSPAIRDRLESRRERIATTPMPLAPSIQPETPPTTTSASNSEGTPKRRRGRVKP